MNKGNDIYVNSTIIANYVGDNVVVLSCTDSNEPKMKSVDGTDKSSMFIPCDLVDYFVKSDGVDSGTCSCNSPCHTIGYILTGVSSGLMYASIVVMGPTFFNQGSVNVDNKIIDIGGFYETCPSSSHLYYSHNKLGNSEISNNIKIAYSSNIEDNFFKVSTGKLDFHDITLIHDSSSKGYFISITGKGLLSLNNVVISSLNEQAHYSFLYGISAVGFFLFINIICLLFLGAEINIIDSSIQSLKFIGSASSINNLSVFSVSNLKLNIKNVVVDNLVCEKSANGHPLLLSDNSGDSEEGISFSVINSSFSDIVASNSSSKGGMFCFNSSLNSVIYFENSTFDGIVVENTFTDGGLFYIRKCLNVSFLSCSFSNVEESKNGGCMIVYAVSNLYFRRCNFSGCKTIGNGGALLLLSGLLNRTLLV
jgi:hypothetical protein